ncbi:hypothetical protein Athai_00340 [Actinocatenispora thailandica]|uniref:Uncharacterized protein n=1 Tax=Actinocatenispora thailandica TaxID=227318 RepID=A0A7R7DJ71_9ACTN|nr:hypothetical protein [Actinocatenispora thailandica]BCJ32531.1 hypothetical protein Athai_00340 [Actinocatenispora thailandica]
MYSPYRGSAVRPFRGPVAAAPGDRPGPSGSMRPSKTRIGAALIDDRSLTMKLYRHPVTAVRRLAERIRIWRDEIAAYPVDADRWLR